MVNITVVGTGYVGLSLSVLLAQHNNVTALEIDDKKVELINNKISPIADNDIEIFLKEKPLNLIATTDKRDAYINAEFVIVATPTDYDPNTNYFNTSTVENVIRDVFAVNSKTTIIIKSTIPVGFTKKINKELNVNNIVFSPEFLREGKALWDNLHPSRIIVGQQSDRAVKFGKLLVEGAQGYKSGVQVLYTSSCEAEAIKLFSNTYLAMRIAYFNEIDTYCETHGLNSKNIINGVGLDPRIGSQYNNPSFGYGGYCLPKDTKQLLANYKDIPNNIISAIVDSNTTRKKHIANIVLNKKPRTVGIYRLVMKKGSDNFRDSAILDIINILIENEINIVIYEPTLKSERYKDIKIINDIELFKTNSDLILTNRYDEELESVACKIYTRDIFGNN